MSIKNCATSKDVWKVLNPIYKADTASSKVNLFKKLVLYKFNSNKSFASEHNDVLFILFKCGLPEIMGSFFLVESREELTEYE